MYARSSTNCAKQNNKVVIGTTVFSKKEENLIKKYSKKFNFKSWKHEFGSQLVDVFDEIASKSLGKIF